MRFVQTHPAEKNDVGFFFDEVQPKEVLDSHAVDLLGPTELELLEGFDDRKASQIIKGIIKGTG